MPVTLLSSTLYLNSEGEGAVQTLAIWANPAHDVRVFLQVVPAMPRQGAVPLFYSTLLVTFNQGGENITREEDSRASIGWGVQHRLLGLSGFGSVWAYRRRNGISGILQLRVRQINFSI